MTLEDLHDEYGYITYVDPDNGVAVGILLDARQAKIYYLDYNPSHGKIGEFDILSEEEIDYLELISDFPDAFEDCENAEVYFRGDIIDEKEVEEIMTKGNFELENRSFLVINMI